MGTWVHWVLFDIPGASTGLPEGIAPDARREDGSIQGLNSWGLTGYRGPSPPRGKPHRYDFKLYALDTVLKLGPRTTKLDLLTAMRGHVLAESRVVGTYGR